MKYKNHPKTLTYIIAAVWGINGLICKILNVVPRHEEIVERILGIDYARPFTVLIGVSELIMGIWILTGFKPKLNAIAQMSIVAVMNILEFIIVPDLLVWGRFNSSFALVFIGLVYYNAFVVPKKLTL